MAEIDVENVQVYYSLTDAAGSYLPLPEASGYAFTSDTDDEAIVKTFGGGRKVRTGDDTDTYDISALFDPDGQKAFRDAKRNKTLVYIVLAWDRENITPGVADAVIRGQKQTVKLSSYGHEGDADGDFIRASFAGTGEGALTEISKLP